MGFLNLKKWPDRFAKPISMLNLNPYARLTSVNNSSDSAVLGARAGHSKDGGRAVGQATTHCTCLRACVRARVCVWLGVCTYACLCVRIHLHIYLYSMYVMVRSDRPSTNASLRVHRRTKTIIIIAVVALFVASAIISLVDFAFS